MTPHVLRRAAAAAAAAVLMTGCAAAQDIASDPGPATQSTAAPTTSLPPPTTEPPTTGSPTSESPTTESPTTEATPPTPTDLTPGLPEGFGEGPPGTGVQRFYQQQVTWSECDVGGECADIWVPLDYADPDGPAITIKAKREPAGDPGRRLGSLLINPGGPGGSGIDYLDYAAFDSSITDAYDIVGFDPRGVARSTPVDCLSDEGLDAYVAADPTPDDAGEVEQFRQTWSTYTDGCVQNSGPLLEHVSTVEVARDMDIIREVVGDKRLHYFGASYGTYIGATYAALFPKNVDRMVLDGAVDPLAEPRTTAINQAAGFDKALTAYLEYCVDEGNCPLGDDVSAARQRLIQLFEDIDESPLPTSSGREVTEGLAFLGVIVPLYSRDTWYIETTALEEAVNGSGDTLLLLADAYTERQSDGSYLNNGIEVQSAVNCLDHPENESLSEIEAGGRQFLKRSPTFGQAAMWWPYACSNWPATAAEPQPDYSAKGAPPIVVVGTTRDPATPYEQSVKLAKELDSGVLLSRDGDGHTAYGAGNACIDDAINTYLVTGKPPADKTTC